MINIIDNYKKSIKNYFKIKGRATRAEYWTFNLVNLGLLLALSHPSIAVEWLGLFVILTVIPHITLAVRRMHDFNFSAIHTIWLFLPFIQAVFFFYLGLKEGDLYPNKYGRTENTKEPIEIPKEYGVLIRH